eukprot:snap_masked-scaffold_1-processed-gene-4.35-mRNA-1 protein AED:0.29 eAED:1.00 QI:0/-1/0/1/-1/1/1/0/250
MKILIVGATGGIGSNVVKQAVENDIATKVVCRSEKSFDSLQKKLNETKTSNVESVVGNVYNMKNEEVDNLLEGVDVIVSGLGHTPSFKGICLPPYNLVTKSVQKLCEAAVRRKQKVKFICTGTVGIDDLTPTALDKGKRSLGEKFVLGMLYYLISPHRDNYNCGKYFGRKLGSDNEYVSWCWVRPDGLINQDGKVTEYEVFPELQTSLFTPLVTSRENVANFMLKLAEDEEKWTKWKNSFPVILNKEQKK